MATPSPELIATRMFRTTLDLHSVVVLLPSGLPIAVSCQPRPLWNMGSLKIYPAMFMEVCSRPQHVIHQNSVPPARSWSNGIVLATLLVDDTTVSCMQGASL